jgi:hypothetical protein
VPAPTRPYTTATKVSYLLLILFKGAVPSASTVPDETQTGQAISWAASQLEQVFAQVGYVVPFAEISGETWPVHQTDYLDALNAIGAAGFVGGHMLRPAPAIGPSKGQQFGNLYQELFDKELGSIIDGKGKRFRADYYQMTPAEQMLATPYGPQLDFTAGYYARERYIGLEDLVELFDEYLADTIDDYDLDWDYLYNLRT